jgi:hypothetical protein
MAGDGSAMAVDKREQVSQEDAIREWCSKTCLPLFLDEDRRVSDTPVPSALEAVRSAATTLEARPALEFHANWPAHELHDVSGAGTHFLPGLPVHLLPSA